jgi:replicative DNA helicase
MLLSRDAISAASEVVKAAQFYRPAHGHVFEAITALYAAGEPADPITVAEELRRAGLLEAVGGEAAIVRLQAIAPAVSNAGRYAVIVTMAGEIAELGYSLPEDVAGAVDAAESLVYNLAQHRSESSLVEVRKLLDGAMSRLEQLYEVGTSITGTPTGYVDLDELLSGLQPSALIVVGARPAMGKTAFALGMAANAAINARLPVLVFSLEMSHIELVQRLLSSEARVDASKMRNGRLTDADWEKITRAMTPLGDSDIWIDDNPNVTVMEIRSKARKLKAKTGKLGLIVVDYIQLMTGRNGAENRQVEVAEISRGLKILARELETPVIALAQLNRGLEQRADKRPMLSDLRESGSLEQDADVVLFLYRDEVYNAETQDAGIAEVIVAKHRSGPTGTVRLAWLGQFTKFANMARDV